MNGSDRPAASEAAGPVPRPAQVFRLEIVRVSKDGRRRRRLTDIPVAIHEAPGKVEGPYFLERLAKGRYALTTHYDAWSFMSPVTIDKARRRVVLENKS
jgi:hypothetical protein